MITCDADCISFAPIEAVHITNTPVAYVKTMFSQLRSETSNKIVFYLTLSSGLSKSEEEEEAAKWLDPYALANRGIFASYLSVGFGLYFILTPLTFYMVRIVALECTSY